MKKCSKCNKRNPVDELINGICWNCRYSEAMYEFFAPLREVWKKK